MEWYVKGGLVGVVFLVLKYLETRYYPTNDQSDKNRALRGAVLAASAASLVELYGVWCGTAARPQLDALTGEPAF